jgi:hypothetical protein
MSIDADVSKNRSKTTSNRNPENEQFKYSTSDVLIDLKKAIKPIVIGFFAMIFVLAVSVLLSYSNNVPFSYLSRDVVSVVDQPIYIGFLSNVGMVGWAFAAGFCFIGYYLLRPLNTRIAYFFLYSAFLTVLLLIDDLFLLHEVLMPDILNISTKIWFIVYIAGVLGLFGLFYKEILRTKYFILLFAFGFFALSIAFDYSGLGLEAWASNSSIMFHNPDTSVATSNHEDFFYLIEDGFKFGGILLWMIYFGVTTADLSRKLYNK